MIYVDLTPEEALAYEQCGNIENEQEACRLLTLKLIFETKMEKSAAEALAAQIAAAAQSARRKIAEATAFEIKVVEPSTEQGDLDEQGDLEGQSDG